jgi:outer membrane protein OmpA-like peptidoglycan-associated protein
MKYFIYFFFLPLSIIVMAMQPALAQQGENLVRNGDFEQGYVGFRSNCRYFSFDAFWNVRCEGFQPDSIYFSKNPFGVENIDPYGKKDSLYFSKDAYGESFFVTNNRFYFYEKFWKCLVVDSLELAFRLKQCTNRTYSETAKDTTGNFLLAWNAYVRGYEKLWYDSITIKPNTTYSFSCIESWPEIWKIFIWNGKAISSPAPGIIKLCVNGKKVSNWRIGRVYSMNGWRTLSGTFTSGTDQTTIEISIENMQRYSLTAIDNIVFKEIQPREYENEFAKEERFPKLEEEEKGVVLPRGVKQDEDWFLYAPRVKKEEAVVETPPVKKEEAVVEISPVKEEEPIAVITPPVKKEEAVVEIPPVKEEEPVVEIPPVKEEPVVEILPKTEPPVIVLPKEKPSMIIPPNPKLLAVVTPESKHTVEIPPKPKPPVIVQPKEKTPVVVPSKPVKKETASQKVAVSADFKKDISIDEIKVDQKLQLSHIYFDQGKFNLLATSIPELNELAAFMKKYPTVRIKLEGHTDNQGNPERNVELSKNRAREIKKYLVEQGIDENRIEWIGYGGQRPAYSNADKNLRPKNRRVEIVIIGK